MQGVFSRLIDEKPMIRYIIKYQLAEVLIFYHSMKTIMIQKTDETTNEVEGNQAWKAFFDADRFAVENGCRIIEAAPGYAKIQLEITPHHHNAVGITQGGALYTLADFAFAVASNAANEKVVGTSTYMNYFKATRSGILTATAKEISRSRKLSTVEVKITDEQGVLIAQFQGNGYVLGGALLD